MNLLLFRVRSGFDSVQSRSLFVTVQRRSWFDSVKT